MATRRPPTLAQRLLALDGKMTRQEVAEALGLRSKQAVLNLMRGAEPRLSTARRASELLGVPLDTIAAEFDR
jgi:transcriptional regulator with XRE-family HTH domain